MNPVPKISVVLPVLAPTPFLRAMTEFAIKALRCNAVEPFELIVAEAVHDHFDPESLSSGHGTMSVKQSGGLWNYDPLLKIDKYLNFNPKIGGIKESNAAIDVATGEFIVLAGTDVIVPPGWDAELLRVFAEAPDCGAAALSAFEPNATIGPREPLDLVVEGMFSPFMMIRNHQGWRWDEAYQRIYQDSDLILRMRAKGLHPYRSCRAHVWHLGSVTNKGAGPEHAAECARALAHDERLFYRRWGKSPTATFAMMRGGAQIYGHEHDAYTAKINLHYDPMKEEG